MAAAGTILHKAPSPGLGLLEEFQGLGFLFLLVVPLSSNECPNPRYQEENQSSR